MSTIEQLSIDISNSWERINAIVEDMRDIEPTADLPTAALHGLLRELQDQTIHALVTIGQIQRIGRKDGYPEHPDRDTWDKIRDGFKCGRLDA